MVRPESEVEEALPPGVYREGARLWRDKERLSADGEPWTQRRGVSLDLAEARRLRLDYYHPAFGWIIEGYKRERDASLRSIIDDDSGHLDGPESEEQ